MLQDEITEIGRVSPYFAISCPLPLGHPPERRGINSSSWKGKVVFGGFEHPWLDPLWRRILLVLFCGAWTGVEYLNNNQTWAIIIAAITAYAAWGYLFAYKVTSADEPRTGED
jgi:hypothetical protein